MKQFILFVICTIPLYSSWLHAEKIKIDIHGMTCAFCVDSLERNLGKLSDIKSAEVSLKLKKIRIETHSETADINRIKQTILDSGFTPGKISAAPDVK